MFCNAEELQPDRLEKKAPEKLPKPLMEKPGKPALETPPKTPAKPASPDSFTTKQGGERTSKSPPPPPPPQEDLLLQLQLRHDHHSLRRGGLHQQAGLRLCTGQSSFPEKPFKQTF